jgi:hypothetical protein
MGVSLSSFSCSTLINWRRLNTTLSALLLQQWGVTVASVAVATASHIVALAFAVVAAGELFAAALNVAEVVK